MEIFREFLETSTIHGLAYISSAPSKVSKVFWLLVVVFGFSTAVYLINSSYNDWQASPIATSISTHPISELEFPTITVCPPEDSNTALNYDLVRAQNITLTESEREGLVNAATHFLIDKPCEEFMRLARSVLNEENILEIFESKPTYAYPFAYNEKGHKKPSFEIWSSTLNGTYKTPRFGENQSCDKTVQSVHFVLQLPLVVMQEAYGAVLDFQIEIQSNDNWVIQYREGGKYFVDPSSKSWQDAESICIEKGGHLASVKNLIDVDELDTGTIRFRTWLGGTDKAIENVWVWPDGSTLGERGCSTIESEKGDLFQPCNQWAEGHPNGGELMNCISIQQSSWFSNKCTHKKPFVCQTDPSNINANRNQTLRLEDVDYATIELWLKRRPNSRTEMCKPATAIPGFSVAWKTRMSGSRENSKIFDVTKVLQKRYEKREYSKTFTLGTYLKYVAKNVRYQIVRQSKQFNMSNTEIWDMVISWKREVVRQKLVTCSSNVVRYKFFTDLFHGLVARIPSDRPKVAYKETNDDLCLAFDIFSYMIYCEPEAMELQVFFENLFRTGSTSNIMGVRCAKFLPI